MNIHEYQGKSILEKYKVKVQRGYVAETPTEAVEAAKRLSHDTGTKLWVVKSQIHAGGRGKGVIVGTQQHGVALAKNLDDVKKISSTLIGGKLVTIQTGEQGKIVNKVFIGEDVYYPGESEIKEFYFSILLDRAQERHVIMYSTEGGMDIETVAANTPDKIFKEWIDPSIGIQGFQARRIAFNLGLTGIAFKKMAAFVPKIYKAYEESDASMIEINPLLKTSDDDILAVDCKFNIDDNALYRHKDISEMRDLTEEDPAELEAAQYDLNYVQLEGNVGCMVNGAGLAMATMDIIKLSGGDPANFLDVGGTANAERVEAAFKIILKDPKVQAILINIFGGIVRCDRVAEGVIQAYKNIENINIPIIVRLQGTNAEIAKEMIENSGLKVKSAILLSEAAQLVKEALA